jgi:hypothetical protein
MVRSGLFFAPAAALAIVLSTLYEFGAKNRMEGQTGFLNVAIPLGALPAQHGRSKARARCLSTCV